MADFGYDERATNFFTTNTALFATSGAGSANPIIGGLSVTVVGTGDPVWVEFYCPAMGNVSTPIVTSYFVVNGAVSAALGQYRNWATGAGEGGLMRRRMVLANGTSYTFEVGLSASAGSSGAYGQVTAGGSSAGVMHLRVSE